MGMGAIQVWITGEGDPCGVSQRPPDPGDPAQWVVAVWECTGKLLNWCGREYFNIRTECGHVEIEVPPGRYVIRAADAQWLGPDGVHGNHWTDHGVVTVGCDEKACVTLFAPSAHHCGEGFGRALETLVERGVVDAELARPVLEGIRQVIGQLRPGPFERRAEGAMLKLVEAALNPQPIPPGKGDPPRDRPADQKGS
jgi:hypothetical protein